MGKRDFRNINYDEFSSSRWCSLAKQLNYDDKLDVLFLKVTFLCICGQKELTLQPTSLTLILVGKCTLH